MQRQANGKGIVFSADVVRTIEHQYAKKKENPPKTYDPWLASYTKSNSKWIKINVKCNNLTTKLEENIGIKSLDFG